MEEEIWHCRPPPKAAYLFQGCTKFNHVTQPDHVSQAAQRVGLQRISAPDVNTNPDGCAGPLGCASVEGWKADWVVPASIPAGIAAHY